jgi:DnaJ like chaperone protein
MLLFVGLLAGGVIASRNAARAKKQSADAPQKPKIVVYHDYGQYQQALQSWLRESNLFPQQEAARLAGLETKLKEGGPLSGLGCLGFIVGALLLGTLFGSGAGWSTVIVGVFVVGLLSMCEQQFRRWRWREQLKPQVFADVVPEPVYEGPPPGQHSPPPRQEPPPRRESAPPCSRTGPVRVTSLRQAFEILRMPPGRTTLSVARAAYRARMSEYHPDKTMHLGKELQELAARKALEINLAMKFVEENCTRPTAVPGQSATRSSPRAAKTESSTRAMVDQILQLKHAVPFRPFSIEIRQNGQAPSTTGKAFFIRYPDWVCLKDDTSIVLRTDNTDHTYVIPVTEIQRVAQGVYERGPKEEYSKRKTEEARPGDKNAAIYPENSIVSAAEDDPQRIFIRGPFESLEEDAFCDPYVMGLDYIEEMGRSYISINSWRGRIPYGTDKDCLLGNEILEFASRGGWDWDNDYAWEEVCGGGADVIPHYVTKRIAAGLCEFLRTASNEIEFEGRTIDRDTLQRAAKILEAGPTTIPW